MVVVVVVVVVVEVALVVGWDFHCLFGDKPTFSFPSVVTSTHDINTASQVK